MKSAGPSEGPRFALLALVLAAGLTAACPGTTNPGRTVEGRVLDGAGAPVRWLEVRATGPLGWTQPVDTGADGAFRLEGVSPTYDLAAGTSGEAVAYLGLTRADPTIIWPYSTSFAAPVPLGYVSGLLTGDCGGTCPPDGKDGAYFGHFTASDHSPMPFWDGALPGTASSDALIPAGGVATGTLHALYWTCDPFCGQEATPEAYWHAESAEVSVMAGEAKVVALPPLAPVASTPLRVDLVRPQSFTGTDALVYLSPWFGPGRVEHVAWVRGVRWTPLDFPLPVVPGFEVTVGASTFNGPDLDHGMVFEHHLPGDTAQVTLAFRPAPGLRTPAAGSAVGPGTTFSWTPSEGVSQFVYGGVIGGPALRVFTTASQVTWNDQAPYWPRWLLPGAAVEWEVYASGPAASVDAVAGPKASHPVSGRQTSWWSGSELRAAVVR